MRSIRTFNANRLEVAVQTSRSAMRAEACASEFAEVKLIPCHAEIIDDVGNNSAGNVTCVPGEGNDSIRSKRIGVMSMAAAAAKVRTTDLPETAIKLSAVERGILAHDSRRQYELIPESGRNGAPCFKQGFQMGLCRFLKAQDRLSSVAPMGMASRKKVRFGDPDAILVTPRLNFRDWNDHRRSTITFASETVKQSTALGEVINDPASIRRRKAINHQFSSPAIPF